MNLDRFTIDDGRHLPQLVIDEDASSAAGTARYRAACSCDRMQPHTPGTRDQALAAHLATSPPRSPRPRARSGSRSAPALPSCCWPCWRPGPAATSPGRPWPPTPSRSSWASSWPASPWPSG
ncbi:hypothetical protein ID875_21120 [Streptomyces globisporus]|uniref:Uncharacterized protein n=1 Tax=Streptomyces globisporus TaxID=1908 RepID=A0A927BNA8_STRGL|nr:hypothetical protein [Streptomyces globisporus]